VLSTGLTVNELTNYFSRQQNCAGRDRDSFGMVENPPSSALFGNNATGASKKLRYALKCSTLTSRKVPSH
jgi:hypothetical protein